MIEVRCPTRLHFGLLAYRQEGFRQYGGVGLMVRRPDLVIRVTPAEYFKGSGPLGDRAAEMARGAAERAVERGWASDIEPLAVQVLRAPRSHIGLGSGTQLGMAVARAVSAYVGKQDLSAEDLAFLAGRGERSAVGAYGFVHGGLIVEGGKRDPNQLSPLLMQMPFPDAWRVVLIMPGDLEGLAGVRERQAFAGMAPIPSETTARMCQLVLLGLVPSMLDGDLAGFGEALYDLQQAVGRCFVGTQGGIYASAMLEQMVGFVRDQGVAGVGQSSWGPTIYAVVGDAEQAADLAGAARRRFALSDTEVLVTQADNHGAVVRQETSARAGSSQ